MNEPEVYRMLVENLNAQLGVRGLRIDYHINLRVDLGFSDYDMDVFRKMIQVSICNIKHGDEEFASIKAVGDCVKLCCKKLIV